MHYKYLSNPGALNEAGQAQQSIAKTAGAPPRGWPIIPPHIIELVPESVARETLAVPIKLDGETLTFRAAKADDIGLADKLRFILNKNVRLIAAPAHEIRQAIDFYYGRAEAESVDSMLGQFTGASIPVAAPIQAAAAEGRQMALKGSPRMASVWRQGPPPPAPAMRSRAGGPAFRPRGESGVFYHVVEEGQRDLMRGPDGTMQILVGPRRVWAWRLRFERMQQFLAHPGEYLIVRFRDGRQEHVPGPAEIWLDPRIHREIACEDALQLAAKEAVVVYSRAEGAAAVTRRIQYGPGLFVPRPGEWLHTFSWHASKGGHKGVEKIPNGLVFQKLWLLPDQMYHDVTDVRTSDDALLTVRLMMFFELVDIERMLETTHDPIGDFVNAATSDVVAAVGKQDFDSFKRNTALLNELETYSQLTGRAAQCGYRINKVVYRGYGAPTSLQQMHDQAIEARTKLQLERATEQQAQDLENYKLDCQIARAGKRRTEQGTELDHDLESSRRRAESDLRNREAAQAQAREQRRLEAEMQLEAHCRQDAELREHAAALRELGVDLTAYLTQARADRVIELRGGGQPHVHLEQATIERGGDGVK